MNKRATRPQMPANFEALDECHRRIVEHLGKLAGLVERLDGDGADAQARSDAQAIEAFFSDTSRKHHADEEAQVFPPLLAGNDAELIAAVRKLQQDHGWIEEDWIELAPQLRAVASGYNWYDADELRHAVQVFIDLCHDHIELEESLIYPQARALSAQAEQRRARRAAAGKSAP